MQNFRQVMILCLAWTLRHRIIKEFRLLTHFVPQRTKKFVRISKKFELTNLDLQVYDQML